MQPEIQAAQNGGIFPRFYIEAVEDKQKSLEEGRPVFRDVEMVEIIIAGDRNNRPVRKVRDQDKIKWSEEYRRFKDGEKTSIEGTPIESWPQVTTSQVKELKYFDVLTVEALAALPDAALQNLGMGSRELRDKAKAFLEAAKDGAAIQKYAVENEKLKTEMDFMKNTIEELKHQVEVLAKRRPKGAATTEEKAVLDAIK